MLIGFIDTAASAGGTADEPGAGGVSVNDVVLGLVMSSSGNPNIAVALWVCER